VIGDRVPPPRRGDDRANLQGVLDFVRGAVVRKAAGLTEEQARTAAVPSSALTPAGIVKHLTATERFWFSIDFADLDVEHPWPEDDRHGAFAVTDEETIDGLIEEYRAECGRSDAAVAGYGLDEPARAEDMDFTLRYAYAHMIEETARHAGHLDLIREAIDGLTGQ
jgi:uncharacterized protein DUF664